MKNTEMLLIANSVLLVIVNILFAFSSFFLRNLHKQFTQLQNRFNGLDTEVKAHISISKIYNRQVDKLETKIDRIDDHLKER